MFCDFIEIAGEIVRLDHSPPVGATISCADVAILPDIDNPMDGVGALAQHFRETPLALSLGG
jgi:hypothetical protein